MSKMKSMSQHDPWGSMYTVPDKVPVEQANRVQEPIDKEKVKDLIEQALYAQWLHHKQWYLWKIAEVLGVSMDIDADKGIEP